MAIRDSRAWIARLEEANELRRVTASVDWKVELGAVAETVMAQKGPALLFENIKGYESTRGRRVLVNQLGKSAQSALLFGKDPSTSFKDLVVTARQAMKQRVSPVVVDTGPVKQNVVAGDGVDLYDFPIPQWNEYDGGRYINTWCGVVTKDPDSDWINVGLYRGMIGDRNHIAVLLAMGQHWGHHFAKYRARGQSMPVAVFYGGDPMFPMIACSEVPPGVSEYEVVGAIRGEPVRLTKCETSELLVPADAEIVVEGHISADPSTFMLEGPFREYSLHYSNKASPKPTICVDCITHRDDPIYQGSLGFMGNRVVTRPAHTWNLLEAAGVPGVTDVWCNEITAGATMIVQIHKTFRGQAKQVAMALWGSSGSQMAFKNVVVVDDDIDIRDHDQVDWAMAFRMSAKEGDILFYPGCHGSPLDPSTGFEERDIMRFGSGAWTRVLFDATKNWDFEPREEWGGDRFPSTLAFSREYGEHIKRRWSEYGL